MRDLSLIKKCQDLRKGGSTLGEIAKETGLPKTTIYDHIFDIPVSFVLKQKLEKREILENLCHLLDGRLKDDT